MYNGTKQATTARKLYTGLSTVRFIGINLTQKQFKDRLGIELDQEPEYKDRQDQQGNDIRACVIFLKDVLSGGVYRLQLGITSNGNISKKGNYQVCTSNGEVVWAGTNNGDENVIIKSEFANHRPLVRDEAKLIQFVQKLVGFDTRSGVNWMEQMTANGQSAADVFAGKLKGFDDLYEYCEEQNKTIAVPLEVREDGDKAYQQVCDEPRTWFSGGATTWAVGKLKEWQERQLSSGYSFFKHRYTYQRQEFDANTALGAAPVATATSTADWNS